jgi:hypothetical protein
VGGWRSHWRVGPTRQWDEREREKENWAGVILYIRIYIPLIHLTVGPKSSLSVHNDISQTTSEL